MAFTSQTMDSRLSTVLEGEESTVFRSLEYDKKQMEKVAETERSRSEDLSQKDNANDILISTARELIQEKQWIAAEGILKNVIDDNPHHKEAYKLLGIVLSSGDVRHARYEKALSELNHVLKLDPTESKRREITTLMGKINRAINMRQSARYFCCCTYTIDDIS